MSSEHSKLEERLLIIYFAISLVATIGFMIHLAPSKGKNLKIKVWKQESFVFKK